MSAPVAKAAYTREWRCTAHERMLRGEVTPDHGSVATYRNYSCKCEPCVEAFRAYEQGRASSPQARERRRERRRRQRRAQRPPITRLERFMQKVDVADCWLWTGATSNGYGRFHDGTGSRRAHRWLYEQLVAPIPAGLHLDHLCCVRRCVNPDHLEPVPPVVNLRRTRLPASVAAAVVGHGEVAITAAARAAWGRPS